MALFLATVQDNIIFSNRLIHLCFFALLTCQGDGDGAWREEVRGGDTRKTDRSRGAAAPYEPCYVKGSRRKPLSGP